MSSKLTVLPSPEIRFPAAWLWMVDELFPSFVKQHYSPRESWKDKPFTLEDARFFFKGIEELSEIFTEERSKHLLSYFQHEKFRSSYLLYFLPLQAAKFLTLFQLHARAFEAALAEGQAQGVLRIADLGAGPGIVFLVLLFAFLHRAIETGEELPPIEFSWFDPQKGILEDGRQLVEQLSQQFPRLRGKVKLNLHAVPWQQAPQVMKEPQALMLMGHVLNEGIGGAGRWEPLLKLARGGGILLVEPAGRRPSQQLSQLRDLLFSEGVLSSEPKSSAIWGPCLHAESCPLAEGRDWCHFSVSTQIPGRWFRHFSKGLGSERHWLKFSYLWLASPAQLAPASDKNLRRVVSDPLGDERHSEVLLCEPEQTGRLPLPLGQDIWRGDVVRLPKGR
jgi:hypothetical protein